MLQEDSRRPFQADIPDEIRNRSLAASPVEHPGTRREPHTELRELGMLAAGTGLVISAIVLGAIAGILIAGAVLVLLGRSLIGGDRA